MAAPPEKTLKDLSGKWVMQDISWIIRQAIHLATVTLTITEYTSDDSLTHIDIAQVATGGISGTTEKRTLDWKWRDHTDSIFGELRGRSRWCKLSEVEDDAWLKTGWIDPEGDFVQSYVESKTNSWTADQVWGFQMINGKRYYTRHVVVRKGDDWKQARLGLRKPLLSGITTKLSYRDPNHCWTVEGYNIILEEAKNEREVKACIERLCQLRLLVTAPGRDRDMVGILRLPGRFERRLTQGDRLVVIIDDIEWGAHVMDEQFLYSAPTDITILLHRTRDADSPSGWLEKELSFLDTRLLQKQEGHGQIPDDYYRGQASIVNVRPMVNRKIARI
ncbi:MAG: hypothetical protein Q9163_002117 [Psora crenata]